MSTWERLQKTMRELGIEPKKSLGQNFLISESVIQRIVKATQESKPGFLLEIGPGLGALTFFLKEIPGEKRLIELDKVFAEYWRKQDLQVIEADALQIDWKQFSKMPRPWTLTSNLPYQISSSLVIDRSLDQEPFDCMILMFQKEVAQRIRARQQDELYGMLSVVAQTFWQTEMLLEAGPRDFLPAPKVASRVLVFQRKVSPVADRRKYLKFVKACFLHPRKFLISNLEEGMAIKKEIAAESLKKMGLSEKSRAGELGLEQFLALYRELSLDMKS
jgi:16S rRNA (adenine1518-N6/adenine1519-N6)-dimethyltransferase